VADLVAGLKLGNGLSGSDVIAAIQSGKGLSTSDLLSLIGLGDGLTATDLLVGLQTGSLNCLPKLNTLSSKDLLLAALLLRFIKS
jgi:hypothetical protein